MEKLKIIFPALLILVACYSCTPDPGKIIGVKIYDYNRDFKVLVTRWREMGVNTAFVSQELASNNIFRQILKENNIRVFVIFPVFYNPEALKEDSLIYAVTNKGRKAKDDWVEFVCPSRTAFRTMKINETEELIKKLNPDGLSIDFIRQFVFWEMVYPDRKKESIEIACFCDSCINGFLDQRSLTLPDTCVTVAQRSAFITESFEEDYTDYRCDLIASMAKDISEKARGINPDIKINVHVVPWRDNDFGGANIRVAAQDLDRIAPFADYISPMCYSQMLRRDAGWIGSVVIEMDKKAPGMILPSIQVYPYYIDDPFNAEDFRDCVTAALKDPSKGVVFFSWPLFEKDTVRMDIIKSFNQPSHNTSASADLRLNSPVFAP